MDRPIPDLIQWHEGLLLTPQHFQQLSSRVEWLIQAQPAS
jgi:type VI secretion system protein ImpJ